MTARMWIWPRYALEVDGRRVNLPPTAGAIVARLFGALGHFVDSDELADAAYFGDEDGGPLFARGCIRAAISRSRRALNTIGVSVDGWNKSGRYRLRLQDTKDGHRIGEVHLPLTGNRGPYRYMSASAKAALHPPHS